MTVSLRYSVGFSSIALCVALSSHSEVAAGAGRAAQHAVPTFEQRFAFGVGDTRNMQLELIGAGVNWRLTPALDVVTVALATFTAGSARVGEPGRAGYGGELTLRLRPWPGLAVQPFAYSSIGLLLFPRQPFLPGADVYEGILSSGLGLETKLTPQLSLGAKAFTVHLSNGQGLGPFNPAYDGFGFGLELGYALEPLAPLPEQREIPEARTTPRIGVVLDAELGAVSDASFYGGRLRVPFALTEAWLVVGDVEGGRLGGHGVGEAGAALGLHTRLASAAVHGGYRRFAGFDIAVANAQAAAHVTRETSLMGIGAFEHTPDAPPLWRIGVGARFFPTDNLALDLGIGFDRLGQATFGDDHSDPYFDLEWALPLSERSLCSLFLERQISGLNIVGLRLAVDAGRSLREMDRSRSLRRLR